MASSSSASSLACWSAARWAWKLATSRSRWARAWCSCSAAFPAGLVACPPPAQRRGASYGGGAMVAGLGGEGGVHREWPGAWPETGGAGLVHGQSRVSSATAFLAQASSTRSLPAAAAAMSAATAALFRALGSPLETRCSRAMASSASSGSRAFLRVDQRALWNLLAQTTGSAGRTRRAGHRSRLDGRIDRVRFFFARGQSQRCEQRTCQYPIIHCVPDFVLIARSGWAHASCSSVRLRTQRTVERDLAFRHCVCCRTDCGARGSKTLDSTRPHNRFTGWIGDAPKDFRVFACRDNKDGAGD